MTKLERILLNLPPVKFLTEKSKHIILPGFDKVPLYDVIVFFISEVKKEGLTERASAVAYNFIMAIPPTCLFIFTLIPNLPFIPKDTIAIQLHHLITDMIPAREYNQGIIDFVDGFLNQSRVGLISFGFLLLIFFASNGMMGLMRSFNKNYIGFEKRSDLESRWMAIKLTFIILGLLVACLVLLAMQGVVLRWLGVDAKWAAILSWFRWIFIIGLVFYAIAFIYKYAPAIPETLETLLPRFHPGHLPQFTGNTGFQLLCEQFRKI